MPGWRAVVAARAAKRLIEHETAADETGSQDRQRSRDVETCVYAVDRLAARFAAGADPDDPDRRTTWTALAYLNLCAWQHLGDATCAEQSLLIEVLEAVLTEQPAHLEMRSTVEPADSDIGVSDDQVEWALAAARFLTPEAPDVALHVLIGVALRAMSEMSTRKVTRIEPLTGTR